MPQKVVHETLGNGLEVFLKEDHFTNIVAIQCWVRTGSLHERPNEEGMAHVLEHMLFKGTAKRVVGEIASTVEGCGGNINAYTTFDRTVFYLTLNKNHAALGVELLADAIYNSSFDAEEFAREKEVILEEIRRSNDDPGSLIGRKIFERAYAGSIASRPIIGSVESVTSFTRDDLVTFHSRWYQPENLFFLAVGSFNAEELLGEVNRQFGSAKGTPVPQLNAGVRKFPTGLEIHVLRGDYEEPRIEIAFEAPNIHHPDTAALDVASFALGGGETARLFQRLREDTGIVTSIGASIYAPEFGGVLEVSASPMPDKILEAIGGIGKEIALIESAEPVSEEELSRAQANMKADRVYQRETVEGKARSLGYGLFTPYKAHFDDLYWTLVRETTTNDIQETLSRWIRPERAVVAVLVPKDMKLEEGDVRKAFLAGVKEGQASKNPKKASKVPAYHGAKQPTVIDILPGFRLVYRENPAGELFALTCATRGGLHLETTETNGLFNAISGMLARATASTDYLKLQSYIDGLGASISGYSGKDSFGLRLNCLTEHADPMLKIFAECFLQPVFPEAQWASLRSETLEDIRTQDDSPSSVCIRKFQEMIFQEHPYRMSLLGTANAVSGFSTKQLTADYQKFRDGGPWVFGGVGSMPADEIAEKLRTHFKGFKPSPTPRAAIHKLEGVKLERNSAISVVKEREQVHIVVGYPGLSWNSPQRPALDLMTTVLGGQGGRLFLELRDKGSLAYSVSPIVSYGVSPGIVGAYIATAPEKAERAIAGLEAELARITKAPPSDDETQRGKNYIVGNHESDMQRCDSQGMTMALMEIYGIGFDDFLTYPSKITEVSSDQVASCARSLFDPGKKKSVRVGPI